VPELKPQIPIPTPSIETARIRAVEVATENMGRRRRSESNSKKARTDSVDGSSGDRITALPIELRARIVSLLHYRQIVQLSVLSRPWRHIHHHTPVVEIDLFDFLVLGDTPCTASSTRNRSLPPASPSPAARRMRPRPRWTPSGSLTSSTTAV
jgi:hypothetical protein